MNHILAVACASITGISLGIALHHKQSLGTPTPTAQEFTTMMPQSAPNHYVSEIGNEHSSSRTTSHVGSGSQVERKLSMLLEQQETMRSQQSELNRELNAIQFRLDTHSASFRPLQSERETEALRTNVNSSSLTPLLPPRQ